LNENVWIMNWTVELEGVRVRPRGRPKKAWSEVIEKKTARPDNEAYARKMLWTVGNEMEKVN